VGLGVRRVICPEFGMILFIVLSVAAAALIGSLV